MKENEMNKLMSFVKSEKGATMAEYAVIVFMIILAVVAVFALLGGGIGSTIQAVVNAL
jgi:Flp pilus assembly pilin Flp